MATKYFRKTECPICAGAQRASGGSGGCRQINDFVFCMTGPELPPPPGWKFLGMDRNSLFGMYLPGESHLSVSGSYIEERERRRAEHERAERDRLSRLLPLPERDREIRRLFALPECRLSEAHAAALEARGLKAAEIRRWGFRSFPEDFLKLSTCISPRLAGIGRWGNSLSSRAGMAVPCHSATGTITGWQLAPDDRARKGKYVWPKSGDDGPSAHLPNGEMPVQVARAAGAPRIGLIEGILKPLVAASLSGLSFVGASGGLFLSSREQVREALSLLIQEVPVREITFFPDHSGFLKQQTYDRDCRTIRWVRSLGYAVTVASWGQWDGTVPLDFDEFLASGGAVGSVRFLPADAYLSPGREGEISSERPADLPDEAEIERIESAQAAEEARELLELARERAERELRKKESKMGLRETFSAPAQAAPQPVFYTAGARIAAWQRLQQQGYKLILDTSGCGTGKSHDAGSAQPSDFGASRLIYLSVEHRNPTTPTLALWDDLEARHEGLVLDSSGRLRRWDGANRKLEVAGNCGRVQTLAALRESLGPIADAGEIICQTCPFFEACGWGKVYGWRQQRGTILKESERFRAHPMSLPPADGGFPYSAAEDGSDLGTVLLWDEASSVSGHAEIAVRLKDLDMAASTLTWYFERPAESKLMRLLQELRGVLRGSAPAPSRYGWRHSELAPHLLGASGYLPEELATDREFVLSALAPQLDFLDPAKEYGMSLADMPPQERKKFLDRDAEFAQRVRESIHKQWLLPFLQILTGEIPGYLSAGGGALRMARPDAGCAERARASRLNIFLDATADPERYAALLGVSLSEIAIAARLPEGSAKVRWVQVLGLGRLGLSRTPKQQERAAAAAATLKSRYRKAGVFDFKKFAASTGADGRWWVESHGANDWQDAEALILVGAPQENLIACEAEFACLYGRAPEAGSVEVIGKIDCATPLPEGVSVGVPSRESADSRFQRFCYRKAVATVSQAAGRLRPERRAGQKLDIFFLSEFHLPWEVEILEAGSVCPEAADRGDAVRGALVRWAARARDTAITSAAGAAGCSKQYLSKLAQEWGGWRNFLSALRGVLGRSTNSKKALIELVDRNPELRWCAGDWFRAILSAGVPIAGAVAEIQDSVRAGFGGEAIAAFWQSVPGDLLQEVSEAIFLAIPFANLPSISPPNNSLGIDGTVWGC